MQASMLQAPRASVIRPRVPRRSNVVVQASARPRLPHGKTLKDPTILSASHSYDANVPKVEDPSADIEAYMRMLGTDFSILKMPLGASLTKMGQDYEICVPRIQIFDVWFQPRAKAVVFIDKDSMALECRECVLDGSSHVTDLRLNDVFNLLVRVRFTWDDGKTGGAPRIMSQASIDVDVDIPFPFSAMPRPVLEAAGSTAFMATLTIMLNGFVQSLVGDYDAWARNPALRAQRAQKAASVTVDEGLY
uniref:Uncharacterized protein n=1 Tax=Chlamydomonas leiostraca TaxID=1034604 RepID=A0A7S0S0Z4_9CHLO|mmetsp:Transcript_37638/g.95076  ORF Transcript_37638/g.95076 Transcript_37638/m.95076 type:complete len:248 (+) Transcript_37638:46-789(+)